MIGCWRLAAIGSVSSEERSRQVDGIYLLYSDSLYPCHDPPITSLTTIRLLGSVPLPNNPGRLSNQFHTGADRCTPTLPR